MKAKKRLILFLAVILLANVIYFKFKTKAENSAEFELGSIPKVEIATTPGENKQELELDLGEKPLRSSPFLTANSTRAEFSYSISDLAEESNTQPEESATQEIQTAEVDFFLYGRVENDKRTRIIVKTETESFLLQEGDQLKGYTIKKINQQRVKLAREGKRYWLPTKLKNY